ncbi:restriction endonuclease S subunit [Leptothrix ochracea L12]|uniref:Restriction endonuclease S subunit n=1 Tax=Leptothrix ochracea L12 TaxID=735332 RepID=I4Z595_9BURK|nr:restriction endonuclease subunit S [Leptothrix ochracea]EIM31387.1 restriction endonuclease S subunit [Leptothrix ochracea L12]
MLDLAVRGRLTQPQVGDDQATDLLLQITRAREALVAAGDLKFKVLPALKRDGAPFQLPTHWVWARLGEITNYGATTKADAIPDDAWLLDLEDIEKDTSRLLRRVSFFERGSLSDKNAFKAGDLLYCKLRPYLNKVIVADHDGYCTTEILPVRCYGNWVPQYFKLALKSPYFLAYVNEKSYGMKMPRLGTDDGRMAAFPLPPLAEQHRIVAKVDELMALCDRLEARQQDAEAAHERLVKVLLDGLTRARDAEEFEVGWQRLASAFSDAFTSDASIDKLVQAVRTLAFRGALSREGSSSWAQRQVHDVVHFLNGYAFKSEWFVEGGIRLVRNVNIAHGRIDWCDAACIPAERFDEFAAFKLNEGDVLLTLDRPIISTGLKVAVVRAEDLPCLLLQRVARLSPKADQLRAAFLLHWMRSPLFLDLIDPGRSNGVPHISTKQVGKMTIPVPSLDEQDRIVEVLDELLALCDQLKARIAAARAKQAQLAEVLVRAAAG